MKYSVWLPITAYINMSVTASSEAEAREVAIESWETCDLDDVTFSEGDDVRIEERP